MKSVAFRAPMWSYRWPKIRAASCASVA